MKRNYKISVLGVFLLMTVILLAQIPAVAADGTNVVPTCVQFTKNGEPIGKIDCSDRANDLHVDFNGRGVVQFTQNGKPIGDPQKSTPASNDFIVKWDPLTGQIKEFIWTRDGKPVGNADMPRGANDLHFKTGKIVSATWTLNGEPIKDQEIVVPKGANDLEWYVRLPQY